MSKDFTPRQYDFHTLISMGVPPGNDMAKAMGYNHPSGVSQLIARMDPKDVPLGHNSRIEAAIDMARGGYKWQEIADDLGYSGPSAVFNSIDRYLGDIRLLHDNKADYGLFLHPQRNTLDSQR